MPASWQDAQQSLEEALARLESALSHLVSDKGVRARALRVENAHVRELRNEAATAMDSSLEVLRALRREFAEDLATGDGQESPLEAAEENLDLKARKGGL